MKTPLLATLAYVQGVMRGIDIVNAVLFASSLSVSLMVIPAKDAPLLFAGYMAVLFIIEMASLAYESRPTVKKARRDEAENARRRFIGSAAK